MFYYVGTSQMKRKGDGGMKAKMGSPAERTIRIPLAPIHSTERDMADLARFRAAMSRLTERQQEQITCRIAMPDTPYNEEPPPGVRE